MRVDALLRPVWGQKMAARTGALGIAADSLERCIMREKIISDLSKIMDDIFEKAGRFGSALQENLRLHNLEEKIKAKWDETLDYYPSYSYPPLNVSIKPDKTLIFEFALAGFNEKDIELAFHGDYMIFSARVAAEALPEEDAKYFKRRLRLKDITEQRYYVPADKFNREKVSAVFRCGILKVAIPPQEDVVTVETIKIKIDGAGA